MILPTIRQIQIIADLLRTGALPAHADPAQLTPPWSEYLHWCLSWTQRQAGQFDPDDLRYAFFQRFAGYSEEHRNNWALIAEAAETPAVYPSADQTLAQIGDLQWLWKGWLLRGLPSLLAAVPGTGKSYLALDLARRVIAAQTFPDDQPVAHAGPVLYVDAENTPVIHKERLSVWSRAAMQRLYLMLPKPDHFVINLDDFSDRDRLYDMAWCTRPALIIVDSYGSCTLKGENNKEDVQGLLAFFNGLAQDFDCAVLVIHHLRKGANANPLGFAPMTIDAIRGSSHIAAMARHIWGLQFVPTGPDPEPNGPRRLWIMKTNVGAPPEALGVAFGPHPDNPDVAQLTYGEAPQPFKEPTRIEDCADWVLGQLVAAGEPTKPAEIVQMGEKEGYYKMLIYRARQHLGDLVIDTHNRKHPQNAWALPEWGDSCNTVTE